MGTVYKPTGGVASKRGSNLNMLELVSVVNHRYEKALVS